jgi:hypothetical protein
MAHDEQTGAVTVEVEGRRYTLTPDFNALCELQAITGKHPIEVMQLATAEIADDGTVTRAADLNMARACIWAYLQDQHADEIKTMRDAGKWIQRAGGLDKVDRALSRLADLNEGEVRVDEEAAPDAGPRPAPALNGTGATS